VPIDSALLFRQDASTSEAVISHLRGEASFQTLSLREGEETAARDAADNDKLQAGVDLAVAKGVLPAGLVPAPYVTIAVEGRTPDEVAAQIIAGLPAGQGSVIVLVGLSGTGKGTTVARLAQLLPKVVTWSNGNVFRALTLLAERWCQAQGLPAFDAEAALTPANLALFMGMLDFGLHGGVFDIRIQGLGVDALVSEIANTDLKAPAVSRCIPTVANATQGEVVNFVAKATAMMSQAGHNVIIEGREATVNHIPTPYRFALTLSDLAVIGRRRAAQRVMAAAAKHFTGQHPTPEEIEQALKATAETMV